jgi:hypothetical protein
MPITILGSPSNTALDTTAAGAAKVTLYTAAGVAYTPVLASTRTHVGIYSYALVDQAGQASQPYYFLSLFNPNLSGRKCAIKKVDYNAYAVAATIAKSSIILGRTTAASGGSDQSAGIAKHSGATAPVGVIRTSNPSITLGGGTFKAFPPPVLVTAAGACPSPELDLNPRDELEEVILLENEGIVLYQTAVSGDVDETFNLRISWQEYT